MLKCFVLMSNIFGYRRSRISMRWCHHRHQQTHILRPDYLIGDLLTRWNLSIESAKHQEYINRHRDDEFVKKKIISIREAFDMFKLIWIVEYINYRESSSNIAQDWYAILRLMDWSWPWQIDTIFVPHSLH